MHELIIYRGLMCNDTEELWIIWRWIDFLFQNWHKEFDGLWVELSKFSNIYTLMGCFRPNYIIFELKKYRGFIFSDPGEWCKIWAKTDLWKNDTEEFDKFLPEHSKFSKFGLWWDSFIQIRKCMNLKFTGELRVMAMKNDAKFEMELAC